MSDHRLKDVEKTGARGSSRALLSLIVPFFNEGEGVDIFFERIDHVLDQLADQCDIELVCIDDGSKDDTLQRLVGISAGRGDVRVIEFSRNFGKESALTAGLQRCRGDAAIPIDSDLQDPPELIPLMLQEWKKGAEVVLARRVDRSSDSWAKRFTAEWFYRFHNKVSSVSIPENVGDYRLMDRVVIDALNELPERQRFMKGLFAWVGFRTTTLDYVRQERGHGQSKFSGWKLWNFALEGITSFSTAPLRVWTYLGLAGALVTFFYAIGIIVASLSHQISVPGYASLFVAILFFGSVQLISIGLLGEYIGRLYIEAKQRPNYVIRKEYGKFDG